MARFSIWRQKNKRLILIGVAIIVVFIAFSFLVYIFGWNWTGFNGVYSKITTTSTTHGVITAKEQSPTKTFWDWLQLLIIPFALAIIAVLFNRTERKNELRITSDNQQEAALQGYINEMSELLLEKNLRDSQLEDEVRKIARVRTLTVLRRLDAERKGSVLQFLQESGLIGKDKRIIKLTGADLSGANLYLADLSEANLSANLSRADLSGADLKGANLYLANLIGAILSGADLKGAILSGANLIGADLSEASLSRTMLIGAKVTSKQLDQALSLKDTIMPDGSKHP